ncbi:MAG TPA: triose-phosphate isomerase [Lacibacter sp.]|nr:triose-phosphate isomerase [Lacibacter sp.]HMO89683.1 triose-phosphate isomerase [Lacibacter sp.]
MNRKQIAAANWKMNLTWQEAENLLDQLTASVFSLNDHQYVSLGVPFPYLSMALEKTRSIKHVGVAAQNCAAWQRGAYTGETSAEMLQSMSVQYVILGHSERREFFNESNTVLATKVDLALAQGLTPIFCCGEALPVREAGTQNAYVAQQLEESLYHLDAATLEKIVIAYEPIWAIGTGKTATAQQAQDMHAHLRASLAGRYGADTASRISILYGGSVKGSNAAEIFGMPDVDGGLVGGASLKADEFAQVIAGLK